MKIDFCCIDKESLSEERVILSLSAEVSRELQKNGGGLIYSLAIPSLQPPFTVYIYEQGTPYIKSKQGARTSYGYGAQGIVSKCICSNIVKASSASSGWMELSDLQPCKKQLSTFLRSRYNHKKDYCTNCKYKDKNERCSIGKENLYTVSRIVPKGYVYVREVVSK